MKLLFYLTSKLLIKAVAVFATTADYFPLKPFLLGEQLSKKNIYINLINITPVVSASFFLRL